MRTANQIKAIAGTLKDRGAELNVTFEQIRQRNKEPYQIGGSK